MTISWLIGLAGGLLAGFFFGHWHLVRLMSQGPVQAIIHGRTYIVLSKAQYDTLCCAATQESATNNLAALLSGD